MKEILLSLLLLTVAALPCVHAQQLGRTANRANHTVSADLPDHPAVKWQFKTGGQVVSSPIVSGNSLFIGGADSCLYALDKRSGKQLWKYHTGGEVNATVACDGKAVYFMSEDGNFYALDMQQGRLLWKYKTGGEHKTDPWDYFLSSATVQGGVVYVGSTDNNLYALDARTGGLKWQAGIQMNIFSSIATTKAYGYMGSLDGKMHKLNLRTGGIVTIFETPAGKKNNSRFFDATTKEMYKDLMARYKDDYVQLYADFLDMGSILSTPWIEGGTLFFGSTDGYVYALQ